MCILTILRMHYRPKNGKAELRTLGIFSSWFCLLAAPLSVSPHSAFAVMQSTLQKASRHPAYGGLAVVVVVLVRAKLRQKLVSRWQQQLELCAQPALCCPSALGSWNQQDPAAQGCSSPCIHLSCSPAWGLGESWQVSGWSLSRGEGGRIWKLLKLLIIFLPCQRHEPRRATGTKLSLPCTAMKS